jgi:succinate dehydrogenase/fumarate reductase flavoprotein subunit
MSPVSGEKQIITDVLVIGGGMAGLFAAIKAKEQGLDVTLADKAFVGRSGGTHYSGGVILAFRPERGHTLTEWINLISEKSEYLNNQEWDEICLSESEDRYNDLVSYGVKFVEENGKLRYRSDDNGTPWLALRADGQASMYEGVIMVHRKFAPALREKALESGIRVLDRIMFCELLKQDGEIVGAVGFHTVSGELYIIHSKATVIASGSSSIKAAAQPSQYWTGDGDAMAYRAGVDIASKEFYGTLLGPDRADYLKRQERISKSKEVSGKQVDVLTHFPSWFEGPDSFRVPDLNAEGGPVIISPWEAHCGRAPVYVDLDAFPPATIKGITQRFQREGTAWADRIGFNPFGGGKLLCPGRRVRTDPIPSGSGIWPIDKNCAGSLPGVYAAGNSCATMAAGASYVGMGFGLNHAAVTGARAGLAASEYALKSKTTKIDEAELLRVKQIVSAPMERQGGFSPGWVTQVLHGFTVPYFILQVKHGERLQAAITLVEFMKNHLAPKLIAKDAQEWRMAQEAKNIIFVSEMMLRSSLFRTESRGGHFREDYPRRDDPNWLSWVRLKNEQGAMKLYKEPIPEKWWPDLTRPYESRYPRMLPGE